MPDHGTRTSSFIVVTVFGVVFMVAGIGLIIAGAIGLYNDIPYNGSSWALLWAGIGLELIGSTLLAVARRIRWMHYVESRCHHHQHPTTVIGVASVEYNQPPQYAYNNQAYSGQGFTGQPLTVPQSAAFAAPVYGGPGMSGLPSYANAPPLNPQAPPPYEAQK